MRRYCIEWIEAWCRDHGWTDLFMEQRDYWAFPPGAVMPVPIPFQELQLIKAQYGLTPDEKLWRLAACLVTAVAIAYSYGLKSPMPLVAAFGFVAMIVARFEED